MDFQINTHMVTSINYDQMRNDDLKHQKLAVNVAGHINRHIVPDITDGVKRRIFAILNARDPKTLIRHDTREVVAKENAATVARQAANAAPADAAKKAAAERAEQEAKDAWQKAGKESMEDLKAMYEAFHPAEHVRQNFPDYLRKKFHDEFANRLPEINEFRVDGETFSLKQSHEKIAKAAKEAIEKEQKEKEHHETQPTTPGQDEYVKWDTTMTPVRAMGTAGLATGIGLAGVGLEWGGVAVSNLPVVSALKQSLIAAAAAGSVPAWIATAAPFLAMAATGTGVAWGLGKISEGIRRHLHYKEHPNEPFKRNSFMGNIWEGATLPIKLTAGALLMPRWFLGKAGEVGTWSVFKAKDAVVGSAKWANHNKWPLVKGGLWGTGAGVLTAIGASSGIIGVLAGAGIGGYYLYKHCTQVPKEGAAKQTEDAAHGGHA